MCNPILGQPVLTDSKSRLFLRFLDWHTQKGRETETKREMEAYTLEKWSGGSNVKWHSMPTQPVTKSLNKKINLLFNLDKAIKQQHPDTHHAILNNSMNITDMRGVSFYVSVLPANLYSWRPWMWREQTAFVYLTSYLSESKNCTMFQSICCFSTPHSRGNLHINKFRSSTS